jgi:hypothetical protein
MQILAENLEYLNSSQQIGTLDVIKKHLIRKYFQVVFWGKAKGGCPPSLDYKSFYCSQTLFAF